MRSFSIVLSLLLVVLGVSFAILNHDPVAFNYYFAAHEISLSLLLVLALGFGIVIGFLVTITTVVKLKAENYRLRSKFKGLEQEIANLRAAPIKGP